MLGEELWQLNLKMINRKTIVLEHFIVALRGTWKTLFKETGGVRDGKKCHFATSDRVDAQT